MIAGAVPGGRLVASRPLQGLPWAGDGRRPAGRRAGRRVAHAPLRLEAGVGLRDGDVGITVDVNRDWWGLL